MIFNAPLFIVAGLELQFKYASVFVGFLYILVSIVCAFLLAYLRTILGAL